ncbi:hypothetical protein BpHYR1_027725 [Brachionus plicatilis]|uniref:Uncharacterized protein n=1 Tax=Brachionus plicatilis TaxID=10195 RepID=A0A3M7SLM4_BRAPC|nr:hypothetical protein BpHYR1_027725 [Brachionus plicatilis]
MSGEFFLTYKPCFHQCMFTSGFCVGLILNRKLGDTEQLPCQLVFRIQNILNLGLRFKEKAQLKNS